MCFHEGSEDGSLQFLKFKVESMVDGMGGEG